MHRVIRTVSVLALAAMVFGLALGIAWPPALRSQGTAASGTPPVAADMPPIATDARLAGDDRQTRMVVDLSEKIEMRAFTLADPYRVVIDLQRIEFRFPPRTGERGRGVVKTFRYGPVAAGGSRIVIELTGPARVVKAFMLDAVDDQPARMVVDLTSVDRDTFLRTAATGGAAQSLPDQSGEVDSNHRATDLLPVVVLDPGHGGVNTGTHAPSGESEKTLVLAFSTLLREKLEKTGKYRVVMTRADDTFLELGDRVRLARQNQAQLMISIHCDALARGDGDADGATVYVLSDRATDAEAQRLADAENRADVIAGVDLSAEPDIADILLDLAQRDTRLFSGRFARDVVSELRTAVRLHKNPLKSAGFRVLKAPDVPSVLIELGYVSNPGDLKQLISETWRARAADAIARAVDSYFTARLAGAFTAR